MDRISRRHGGRVDHYAKLVIFLALFSPSVWATYSNAAQPPGWSAASYASERATFRAAQATPFYYENGRFMSTTTVNLVTKTASMPYSMKMASNGMRTAAKFAFGNPWFFAASAVGGALYDYFKDQGYSLDDGIWKKKELRDVPCTGSCLQYRTATLDNLNIFTPWFSSKDAVAAFIRDAYKAKVLDPAVRETVAYEWMGPDVFYIKQKTSGSTSYSYPIQRQVYQQTATTTKVEELVPVPQQEFEDKLAPQTVPNSFPPVLPVDWPVESPVLNPGPTDLPQTLRVPLGDPVPVPLSEPPTYKTPVLDVVPSPTSMEPWRVDVQPRDIIKTSPTPLPDSEPVTPATQDGVTKTEEKTPDLCEKNPDILACQKPELGELSPENVANDTRNMSITQDGGWGATDAACPAPRALALHGGVSASFSYDLLCQFASGIRPVVLALAWLSAALGFVAFGRKT